MIYSKFRSTASALDCVGESIERLLRRELEFSDNTYDLVNSRLVYQTVRPPDEQTNVFVKLES